MRRLDATYPVTDSSAGLYIHFPYCVSICNYCDFDRQATGFRVDPLRCLSCYRD